MRAAKKKWDGLFRKAFGGADEKQLIRTRSFGLGAPHRFERLGKLRVQATREARSDAGVGGSFVMDPSTIKAKQVFHIRASDSRDNHRRHGVAEICGRAKHKNFAVGPVAIPPALIVKAGDCSTRSTDVWRMVCSNA